MRKLLLLLAVAPISVWGFQSPTQTTILKGNLDVNDGAVASPAFPTLTGNLHVQGQTDPTGRVLLPLGQVDYADWNNVATVTAPIITAGNGFGAQPTPTAALTPPDSKVGTTRNGTYTDTTCFVATAVKGQLKYNCSPTSLPGKYFHIAYSVSLDVTNSSAIDIILVPGLNGAAVWGCRAYMNFVKGEVRTTSFHCVLELIKDDVLDIRVATMNASTQAVIIKAYNIQTVGGM